METYDIDATNAWTIAAGIKKKHMKHAIAIAKVEVNFIYIFQINVFYFSKEILSKIHLIILFFFLDSVRSRRRCRLITICMLFHERYFQMFVDGPH